MMTPGNGDWGGGGDWDGGCGGWGGQLTPI